MRTTNSRTPAGRGRRRSARRTRPASARDAAASAPGHLPPPRVVIEAVAPEIEGGRFPIKRVQGETVTVEADIFAEGHDVLGAALRWRRAGDEAWHDVPMQPLVNDRWRASFTVSEIGAYEYTLLGWVDGFASWRSALQKKADAGQDVDLDLREGAELLRRAASGAAAADAGWLRAQADRIEGGADQAARAAAALAPGLLARMTRAADRRGATDYGRILPVVVERERARFGAWYEMFPRSCAAEPGGHGTFRDCAARLPYVASMGFDVLYLPPIHPVGERHRKGPNNTPAAGPGDPGSPWGIGSPAGGHTAVEPALGTLADFDHLVAAAGTYGIEIALDIAFQCSPDHPWVSEHPEWFRWRPDGTVQYAENPPKKYQDIYPLHFEGPAWRPLWEELKQVLLFWIGHGVRIFRVDNPHTKPFAFWEWVMREIRAAHPDTIFLAEAFTRPKIMRHLARLGFSQSYSYFTWRNTKHELGEYFTELTQSESRWYMRPNLFANTPDILHEFLQSGGRPAFQIRLVLAATLGASYGIYGPPFELCEGRAVPGTEEYQDSEKYQIRSWDLDHPASLRAFIARVNEIRRENPALQTDDRLRFHAVDNDRILFYSKTTADLSNIVLIAVNLDPHHVQTGWVQVPLEELGLDLEQPYQVHDLLGDARYLWNGPRNYVALDPQVTPAHIFRVRRRVQTERDFDYFM